MEKNQGDQVEIIVKELINHAVKEVTNDLRSFDMFSLSLSKAKMEMPRIDASIQALQFHEVIKEMKMIIPAWKIESTKECQTCHDTWNNPRHHSPDGHAGPRMCHPSREKSKLT